MAIPFILTETSASIFLGFTPYTVPATHPNWAQIIEALNNPETEESDLTPLLDVAKSVAEYLGEEVTYADRSISYKGKPIDTPLTRRIIQHMNANQPGLAAPLIAFLENVMENPSRRAVQGLYEWLERAGLPITPDGHILAYKIVDENFRDFHTRTFDNSPGKIVEVSRNEVDEDPDQTCSYGLHFCSAGYLPHYYSSTDRNVVIVKIHPADVVAFPHDYDISKGRCCRYEVLQAVPPETAKDFFPNQWVFNPTPEPKFEVGQVWQMRDGEFVQINFVDEDEEYFPILANVLTGPDKDHNYFYTPDGSASLSVEDNSDLINLCLAYNEDDAEIGQKYLTRGGTVVEITDDNSDGDIWFTTSGVVWKSNGRTNHSYESRVDLLALVTEE